MTYSRMRTQCTITVTFVVHKRGRDLFQPHAPKAKMERSPNLNGLGKVVMTLHATKPPNPMRNWELVMMVSKWG
ncbi:hypothetical protein ARSEF4850_007787 [Beauveria asiatica]